MPHKKLEMNVVACGLSAICLGIYSISLSAADSYQSDVAFSYVTADSDDNVDISAYGLGGNYYLSPVSSKGKPLAEAAFLEHASSIGASLIRYDMSGIVHGDGQSWGVEYTHAKKASPWAFKIGALKLDIDSKSGSDKTNYKSDNLYVGLGYFIDGNTLIGGEVSDIRDSYSGADSYDVDGKAYAITFKRVTLLSPDTAFNFEAGYTKVETEDDLGKEKSRTISFGGEYYFSLNTSIGLSYAKESSDGAGLEGKTIGIGLTRFIQPDLYIHASLLQFDAENIDGADRDTWLLAAGYRF